MFLCCYNYKNYFRDIFCYLNRKLQNDLQQKYYFYWYKFKRLNSVPDPMFPYAWSNEDHCCALLSITLQCAKTEMEVSWLMERTVFCLPVDKKYLRIETITYLCLLQNCAGFPRKLRNTNIFVFKCNEIQKI